MITRSEVLQFRRRKEADREQVALRSRLTSSTSLDVAKCFPERLAFAIFSQTRKSSAWSGAAGPSRILHRTLELHLMPQALQMGTP
jgi:hypothetical protein